MRIVLDTNILISSIIESRGPSARLVDAWLDEEAFILVTSTKQLEELLRVMGYDRLRKRIDESRAEALIDGLLHVATVVETLPEVDLSPDPDDNAIIATALAGQADLIVTGDKRDLLSLKHIETAGWHWRLARQCNGREDFHMAHRKRVRHFDHPGHAHELTFSCYHRWPLLEREEFKAMLSVSIDRAVDRHGFELVGFVLMPEHVHLLVFPCKADARISSLLYAIKRPHSHQVKQWMLEHDDSWLGRLTIRERPDKTSFRFWQEGSGYDRNIESSKVLLTSLEYIHANPLRRGLCDRVDQWRWSSWHHYHNPSHTDPDLPTVHGMPEGSLLS